MRRIAIIFLAFFLLQLTKVEAQYFNNKYQFEDTVNIVGYSFGLSAVALSDGYFIGGGGRDSLNRRGIQLLKIDFSGNEIWKKMYVNPKDSFYFEGGNSGFIQTNDGGFALGGSIVDTNSLYNAMLYRFDENGDSLWFKSYPSAREQTGFSCKQTTDGGYIIVGTDRPATGTNRDAWVLKTDSLGNKEWEQTYPLWNDELTYQVILCSDKGYLLSGVTNSTGAGQADAFIIKIDSLGNKKWQKTFGGTENERGGRVIKTADGGYLVGYGRFQNNLFGTDKLQATIAKIDSLGNTEWEKGFGAIIEQASVQSIVKLNNGNYAFCIQQEDTNSRYEGKVLIINENGDSLNYVTIRYKDAIGTSSLPRSSAATNDGGLIVSGAANKSFGQRGFWVIKLDSMGCPAPNCFITGIAEVEQNENEIEMKNYPNPFDNTTTIEIYSEQAGKIMVADLLGKVILEKTVNSGRTITTINNEELKSGTYFYSFVTENRIVETKKMVKF